MGRQRVFKLYVWEGFMPDYTDGLAVALAYDLRQAKSLVRRAMGVRKGQRSYLEMYLLAKPKVCAAPVGFAVCGGG